MTSKELVAHEVIRLLLLDQRDETGLIECAEHYRKSKHWEEIIGLWESQDSHENSLLHYREDLRGIAEMYLGVARWFVPKSPETLSDENDSSPDKRESDRATGKDHFREAEDAFSCLGNCYGVGLAFLAKGFTHRFTDPEDKGGEAKLWFRRSLHEFSQLAHRYKMAGDDARSSRCSGLVGRVRDLLQVLEEKQRKLEYVHLIPHVGKVAAGRPRLIATAVSTDSVSEVIWAGKTYSLLAPWTRDPFSYTFRSDYSYFTTEIQGDSMKGARLEPGDRVLVQHTEDVEEVLGPRDIAVVVIEGQTGPTGLVKRVVKQEKAVLLLSENPSYKTRKFAANKVRIQGKVLGILDDKAPQQPSKGPAEEDEE